MSFYGRGPAAPSTGPTLLVPGSGWTPQGQTQPAVKVAVQPRLVVDTTPMMPGEGTVLFEPDSQAMEVSWLDQELITGMKNRWLVYAGGAALIGIVGFWYASKKSKSSVAG